jgi:hypothetical protein
MKWVPGRSYGDRNFLTATGVDANAYRLAALQDAEVTRLTRLCKEIYRTNDNFDAMKATRFGKNGSICDEPPRIPHS